jgi:hypothetical protein
VTTNGQPLRDAASCGIPGRLFLIGGRLRLFFYWRAFCEARFIVSLFFPDTLQTWQANYMNEAKG